MFDMRDDIVHPIHVESPWTQLTRVLSFFEMCPEMSLEMLIAFKSATGAYRTGIPLRGSWLHGNQFSNGLALDALSRRLCEFTAVFDV